LSSFNSSFLVLFLLFALAFICSFDAYPGVNAFVIEKDSYSPLIDIRVPESEVISKRSLMKRLSGFMSLCTIMCS